MEEEPPEGGRVCKALWVWLLGVVIGGGGEDGSDDVACQFSELDFVCIFEEVPPCGTEVRRFVGVDGGDEVEAWGHWWGRVVA